MHFLNVKDFPSGVYLKGFLSEWKWKFRPDNILCEMFLSSTMSVETAKYKPIIAKLFVGHKQLKKYSSDILAFLP